MMNTYLFRAPKVFALVHLWRDVFMQLRNVLLYEYLNMRRIKKNILVHSRVPPPG